MASRRAERLNEQVKREVADILMTRVKDPRVGGVIVTGAKVATDLSLAQLYVFLPGDADIQKQTMDGLQAAAPFIRSELADRLSVRKLPQLRFVRDDSFAYAQRIEKLLHEINPAGEGPTSNTPSSGNNED